METKEKNLDEKDGEEEDSEEERLEEQNFQEMIKNFWENYKKHWIWVNIGGITANTFFLWLLFVLDMTSVFFTISFTLFYPFAIIFAYLARKSKHQKVIIKILIIGGGTLVLGCLIWLFAGYMLITAPWAPMHDLLTPNLETVAIILLMVTIYGIVAYLLYRYGEKRDWNFPLKY